jgi:hypothetical protein
MFREYRDSYSTKFDSPFTAYLWDLSLSGGSDEESGESDSPTGWFARLGRNIITSYSSGAVYRERFATVDDAVGMFASLDADYSRWSMGGPCCPECGEEVVLMPSGWFAHADAPHLMGRCSLRLMDHAVTADGDAWEVDD